MLRGALAVAAGLLAGVLAAVLAGCGDRAPSAGAPAVDGAPTTSATPRADEPSGGPSGTEGQGRLADGYAYEDQRATTLSAGDDLAVPFRPPAGALGALGEAGVVMPEGGATTLTCDLGAEGSVALRLTAGGAWSLVQTADGEAELASGVLDAGRRGEPGELTALRLLCSGSPDGLAVGVSLHGAGVTFVEGATGDLPPGGPTWTVASTGTAAVRLETVLLTLVEA